MARVEFRMLGTLKVLVDGHPLALQSPRQRIVMAMLLLSANEVVPLTRLIDAVWDEAPPETAKSQVQICVSELRKHLRQCPLCQDQVRHQGQSLLVELEG